MSNDRLTNHDVKRIEKTIQNYRNSGEAESAQMQEGEAMYK